VTRPRLAVFEVLAEGGHLDADQIRARLRERGMHAAVASVYSALGVLQDVGLVRLGALVPGHPARYEVRLDNHHHLLCRNCGALVDVDCAVGEAPCLHPVEGHGYTVERANVTYVGLCPDCQDASMEPRRQRAARIG
jgi:Fur family transcriptional regulator, stress-responsive regulator